MNASAKNPRDQSFLERIQSALASMTEGERLEITQLVETIAHESKRRRDPGDGSLRNGIVAIRGKD